MKKLDKKFGVLIVLSLISLPSLVMADEGVDTTNTSSIIENHDKQLINQDNNGLKQEQKSKLGELIKSLEESFKYIKEHTTSDNLDEIKAKTESLKIDYINKFKDAGAPDEATKKLEERFDIFYKNLTFKQNTENKTPLNQELRTKLDELKKSLEISLADLKKNITSDNGDEIKAKAESLKEDYINKFTEAGAPDEAIKKLEERFEIFYKIQIENRQKQGEMKKDNKMSDEKNKETKPEHPQKPEQPQQNNESQQKNLKQGSMQNYKQQFAKKLESKLSTLNADQINAVIKKVDLLIEKYNSGDLSQDQKDKFVMQLNAIKLVLQDKLDELQNGINLDSLFTN